MFCNACGTDIGGGKFCQACGTRAYTLTENTKILSEKNEENLLADIQNQKGARQYGEVPKVTGFEEFLRKEQEQEESSALKKAKSQAKTAIVWLTLILIVASVWIGSLYITRYSDLKTVSFSGRMQLQVGINHMATDSSFGSKITDKKQIKQIYVEEIGDYQFSVQMKTVKLSSAGTDLLYRSYIDFDFTSNRGGVQYVIADCLYTIRK